MPWGGIARTLSLRSTRSQVAACATGSSRLAASRFTGSLLGWAVRLLWQLTQYWVTQARESAGSPAGGEAALAAARRRPAGFGAAIKNPWPNPTPGTGATH